MPGILYLVPTPLGDIAPRDTIPAGTLEIARRLEHWVVETPKVARRFLKAIDLKVPLQSAHLQVLDTNTGAEQLPALLAPLEAGHDVGLVSDAGCPALADPGARLVRLAHARAITVSPLPGPSAVLLALMGSGMNGQRFAFHGYLPVDPAARRRALRDLEQGSRAGDITQIAIETPYRNTRFFEDALAVCDPQTLLGIAIDLTLPCQLVHTRTISGWRGCQLPLDKRPAVFLLYAGR
jgi:16S rRNA (cytidine1402-2'-O)-methyltransferase